MLKQQAKRGEGGSLCKRASSRPCKIQSGFIQGGEQERAAGCSLGEPCAAIFGDVYINHEAPCWLLNLGVALTFSRSAGHCSRGQWSYISRE